jgi:hypothetical protein
MSGNSRFRFHLLTAVSATLTAGICLTMLLFSYRKQPELFVLHGTPSMFPYLPTRGWPLIYWQYWNGSSYWNWRSLAIDIAAGVFVLVGATLSVEMILRHRTKRRS